MSSWVQELTLELNAWNVPRGFACARVRPLRVCCKRFELSWSRSRAEVLANQVGDPSYGRYPDPFIKRQKSRTVGLRGFDLSLYQFTKFKNSTTERKAIQHTSVDAW